MAATFASSAANSLGPQCWSWMIQKVFVLYCLTQDTPQKHDIS